MRYDFGELVQNFKLERVGEASSDYQLAPLDVMIVVLFYMHADFSLLFYCSVRLHARLHWWADGPLIPFLRELIY